MSGVFGTPARPRDTGAPDPTFVERRPRSRAPSVVSVERGYELWAESYDQEPNPLLALEERLLAPLLPNLQSSRVLDVACGTGRWLYKLLLRGARSGIGIDVSPAMIAAAHRKPWLNGRLVQADILALPLQSASADFVICSFAIGHFPEIGALAAELARVASPQAAIYVSDVHPDAHRRGWRTGFRSKGQAVEIATFNHSLTSVRQAFGAQGLELTVCVEGQFEEPEKPIFEQADRLKRFYRCNRRPAVFISRFSKSDSARRHPGP